MIIFATWVVIFFLFKMQREFNLTFFTFFFLFHQLLHTKERGSSWWDLSSAGLEWAGPQLCSCLTAYSLCPWSRDLTAWGLDEDVDSSSVSVSQAQHWQPPESCLSYTATAGLPCLCSHPLICLPPEGFSLCHISSLHTVRDLIGTLRGLRITVHLNFVSVPQDLLFFKTILLVV